MSWITLSSRIKPAHSRVKLNASVKKRKRRPSPSRKERPPGGRGKYLLILLLLTAAGAGIWWGLTRSAYFSVRKIEVTHSHDYSPEEIIEISGINKGDNIFGMDLAKYRRRLKEQVNIQEASLQRIYPATVRIKVIEREPRARVKYGRYYTIDQEGVILEGRKIRRGKNLPVIGGLKIKEGRLFPPAAGETCLALLRGLNREGIGKYLNIEYINFSSPRLVVMRAGGEMEIKLDATDLSRELQRLVALAPRISGRARSVDLRYANVPVVFKE